MTIGKLKDYIAKLTSHVLFDYNGFSCGIDPLSRSKFVMWYGDNDFTAESVDEVLTTKFFDGKSLIDIWDDITNLDY